MMVFLTIAMAVGILVAVLSSLRSLLAKPTALSVGRHAASAGRTSLRSIVAREGPPGRVFGPPITRARRSRGAHGAHR